jgi:hypothetical protein
VASQNDHLSHVSDYLYYFATIIICIISCSGKKMGFRKGSNSGSFLCDVWDLEQVLDLSWMSLLIPDEENTNLIGLFKEITK